MEKRNTTTKSTKTAQSKSGHASSHHTKSADRETRERNMEEEGNEGTANNHPMLEKFFTDSLKDIYWAEKHLVKALGKLEKSATTEELKEAFREHQAQTEEHVSRLEQVFEMMGQKASAQKCEAMEGITKEAETIMEETEDDTYTRDVALITAAQKAEHYEIASYGSMVQLARTLQRDDVAELLAQTLAEEKETDARLTEIAEEGINESAE